MPPSLLVNTDLARLGKSGENVIGEVKFKK